MSAEVPFVLTDVTPVPRSSEYVAPAEMIASQQSARRVFDMFMEQYAGKPTQFRPTEKHYIHYAPSLDIRRRAVHHGPHVLGAFGYDYPEVVRRKHARDVEFTDVQASGYTDLGRLVHVRVNYDLVDQKSRYFVVVADLQTHEITEQEVVDVAFAPEARDIQNTFETTLYLSGGDSNWPREYWPQVRLGQNGPLYYPGGDKRTERIQPMHQLYMMAMGRTAISGPPPLRVVQ